MDSKPAGEKKLLLRKIFLAEARVLDQRRGYISVSPFNLRMRPEALSSAARLIADYFRGEGIQVIHGIPHSGVYLATAVALELGGSVRLHASRKDQVIPTAWKEVYRAEVRSFTASSEGAAVIGGINLSFVRPGEKVLLIDDVCATGHTAVMIIEGLQKLKIEVVGFGVLFDKIFQGGLAAVEKLGVKTYSCVRIKNITSAGKIIL